MGLIITIILGLVIGVIITALLGIAGSAVGGFLASALGLASGGSYLYQIILGVVGALVLLAAYRVIRGRSLKG